MFDYVYHVTMLDIVRLKNEMCTIRFSFNIGVVQELNRLFITTALNICFIICDSSALECWETSLFILTDSTWYCDLILPLLWVWFSLPLYEFIWLHDHYENLGIVILFSRLVLDSWGQLSYSINWLHCSCGNLKLDFPHH